ncbi:metallophosphoesterase [uncultured Thiodictyon sp.]|uniref:metallophosphoesterase n=1 Tax=uncultured Thiodictyon sp. TaxID=1846217 RepID=UPI0025D21F9A|nr:metallophosphoesterase [uncultured Thiodictyon sp.]
MPADTFSWLHLTDLHYGLKGQDCLWPNLRQPFLDDLGALAERCGPWDAVLFTGDLVQSGESAQFQNMQAEVFGPIWDRLAGLDSIDAVLLAVPGNHDLYRPNPREDNAAIDTLLEPDGFQRIAGKFWDNPDGAYRRVINDAFAAYEEWWDATPHRPDGLTAGTLPGDFAVTIERGGRSIGLIGLNTTFLQLDGSEYQGRLVWDARQLHALCPDGIDTWTRRHDGCLLLSHQGPGWLTPEARKHGATEIAPPGRFAVHLFGHMHEAAIEYIRRGGARESVRLCQACSVFGMEKFGEPPKAQRAHGYTAGRVIFGADLTELRLWPRIATKKTGGWRFIPDHEHGVLESDEGTAAEPVAARTRLGATQSVRTGSAAAPSPPTQVHTGPRSMLPSRRPFFGRRVELERIGHYLSPEHRGWGVLLDGAGGVGKTALALEAAHRAPAERFPLKLWVTAKGRELLPDGEQQLHHHRVDGFDSMLAELGRTLTRDNIPRADPKERSGLLRRALCDQRALVVLDNLETFNREEQRLVYELLDWLPDTCRAIVTSRRAGSSAARTIRLDRLEREAADELLAELGKRWRPIQDLSLNERDRLYLETGGNPLLIT